LLRILAVNLRFNVGYMLVALALVYWWLETNLYPVAGVVMLVGTLVSFAPLTALGQTGIPALLVIVLIPAGLIFFVVGSYRYIETFTRFFYHQWLYLGLILLVMSLGVLGTLSSLPAFAPYMQGTRLTDLQLTLTMLGMLALVVGVCLKWTEELRDYKLARGEFGAFWLVTVGVIGGHLALLVAAGAQIIMERVMSIGYLDVQNALVPLYVLWMIGLLVMGLGVVWLAMRGLLPEIPVRVSADETPAPEPTPHSRHVSKMEDSS
jgi:hypothetical protein